MYNYAPTHFNNVEIKITKFDDNLFPGGNQTSYLESLDNVTDYSAIPWKSDLDPMNAWAVPYVTGHKYKVHWRYGLDFTQMQVDLSSRWEENDKNVYLVMNFTDVRAKVEFLANGKDVIENRTLTNKTSLTW